MQHEEWAAANLQPSVRFPRLKRLKRLGWNGISMDIHWNLLEVLSQWPENPSVKSHMSIYRIVQKQCERWNMYKMCKVQTGREVYAIYKYRLVHNGVNMVVWDRFRLKHRLVPASQQLLEPHIWHICHHIRFAVSTQSDWWIQKPSPRGSKKWYNWKPETRILSTFQTTNGDVPKLPKHVFTSVMFGSHMSHMYLFVHKHSIVISWMWKKF